MTSSNPNGRPPADRPGPGAGQVFLRLDHDLINLLNAMARRDGIPRQAMIKRLLLEAIEARTREGRIMTRSAK